jgi:hypothetical protein
MNIFTISDRLTSKAKARFWNKVSQTDGCWNWTGAKDGAGYGMLSLFGRGRAPAKSHRISWVMSHGEIPIGMEVCHKCDNPACVRPDHLFLGSHAQNMTDAKLKGRMSVKSKGKPYENNNSAKLNAAQVEEIRGLNGGITQAAIGARYGVHRTTVSNILRNKNWNYAKS